jgi:hypothetical protein
MHPHRNARMSSMRSFLMDEGPIHGGIRFVCAIYAKVAGGDESHIIGLEGLAA